MRQVRARGRWLLPIAPLLWGCQIDALYLRAPRGGGQAEAREEPPPSPADAEAEPPPSDPLSEPGPPPGPTSPTHRLSSPLSLPPPASSPSLMSGAGRG